MGKREDIDREVYQWVLLQRKMGNNLTPAEIRQKAFEVGKRYDSSFKASQNWFNNWKKRTNYQDIDTNVKNRKRTYTASFKLQAVQQAAQMESTSQAALALNVSRRCLSRWSKEIGIIASVAEEAGTAIYRRPGQGRKVNDAELDRSLLEWIKHSWVEGKNLTSKSVRDRALQLKSNPKFQASLGWYVKFARRYHINLKEKKCDDFDDNKALELRWKVLPEDVARTGVISSEVKGKRPKRLRLQKLQEADVWNNHYDQILLDWVLTNIQSGKVTRKSLQEKAKELCPVQHFNPTYLWMNEWLHKHGLYIVSESYSDTSDDELSEVHHFSTITNGSLPPLSSEGKTATMDSTEGLATSLSSFLPLDPSRLHSNTSGVELVATISTSSPDQSDIVATDDLLTLTHEVEVIEEIAPEDIEDGSFHTSIINESSSSIDGDQ